MTPREIFEQLQTLDPQQPGNWPRWVHIAASVLLAIVIIGAGFYTFVMPDYDELGNEQKKEQDLRTEFETKQKKVAALDAYKAQLAEMEHSFGDMLKQLPSKTEVANLLNDISQTRVASSLEEELFQPQSEIPKDFYAEIPNKIIVTGTYHEMGTFVSGVAALPRIVTIDEVELKPVGGSAPKDELRMTAYAKTYRYLDESEQHAPAKSSKSGKPAKGKGGK
jgi:type IV pilus assembly protein PilO